MSDTLPMSPNDRDALPLNERSSAFIDGVAFLNFLRMKSVVALKRGGAEETAAKSAGACEQLNVLSTEQDNLFAPPTTIAANEAEIEPEDWDSLFGAVEERLRGTVEALDSAAPQLDSQDKLARIKSVVLDCVSSLDALHKALRHDRGLQAPMKSPRTIGESADI